MPGASREPAAQVSVGTPQITERKRYRQRTDHTRVSSRKFDPRRPNMGRICSVAHGPAIWAELPHSEGRAGKPAFCLLDTGCTTNLLGKHVFDRGQMVESDTHGIMADGTWLPFYGLVQLRFRLKELLIEEKLVVSWINEDVILGMPFLANHRCAIDFNSFKVVDGKQIEKADWFSTAHKKDYGSTRDRDDITMPGDGPRALPSGADRGKDRWSVFSYQRKLSRPPGQNDGTVP